MGKPTILRIEWVVRVAKSKMRGLITRDMQVQAGMVIKTKEFQVVLFREPATSAEGLPCQML